MRRLVQHAREPAPCFGVAQVVGWPSRMGTRASLHTRSPGSPVLHPPRRSWLWPSVRDAPHAASEDIEPGSSTVTHETPGWTAVVHDDSSSCADPASVLLFCPHVPPTRSSSVIMMRSASSREHLESRARGTPPGHQHPPGATPRGSMCSRSPPPRRHQPAAPRRLPLDLRRAPP